MTNGKAHSGPPFAVITAQGSAAMPSSAVSEMLEMNAAAQAKGDLTLGPIFRKVADSFREWSKTAEPGWPCQAPQIGFFAIRLASNVHIATFLSDEMEQQIKDQAAQVDPAPQEADLPRIFRE